MDSVGASSELRRRPNAAASSSSSSSNQEHGQQTKAENKKETISDNHGDSIVENIVDSDRMSEEAANKMNTGEDVKKSESKMRRILVRLVSGVGLIGIFVTCTYMGHVYISLLVALVELLLFRELVKVRYKTYFDSIENTIPLFRTTQWLWFTVAIFYTYSDFLLEVIQGNPKLHFLLAPMTQYAFSYITFLLYSGTLVISIATMQVGHIRFQLNQLCWTIVVLCITVGQLKYIMHNIFNGLFWFCVPIMLVVTNDIMAYVSGMTCGRKFIQRPFISFSPNKTWEGFIGGWIFTMIAAWYLARFLTQYTWMTCPTNEFRLFPEPLQCELDPIFHQAQSIVPSQIFELLPKSVVKMIPNIVEICAIKQSSSSSSSASSSSNLLFFEQPQLTRCISGEKSHIHHHFVLVLNNVYPIQLHALWLALFASLVAPFGGFLASAIKRAYGIKDFDSIIPGHGGVMDRFDCQLLMALYTWVHYNTFVKLATVSVPKLLYMYSLLSERDKMMFLEQISTKALRYQNTAGNIYDQDVVVSSSPYNNQYYASSSSNYKLYDDSSTIIQDIVDNSW